MTFLQKLELIDRVDGLIRRKATGSASALAERLGVSRSTVFEILACMKNLGAEIEYDEYKKAYYYTVEKELAIGFVISDKIKGGKKRHHFFGSPIFSDWMRIYL